MNPYQNKKDLERIIKKYVAGIATAEEIKFLESYYDYLEKRENVLDQSTSSEIVELEGENYQAVQAKIEQAKSKRKYIPFYRYVAAAVLLISFGIGAFYFTNQKTFVANKQVAVNKVLDIKPGVDRAILTLADGSKVILDENTDEKIVEKSGLVISKTKDGQLIYTVTPANNNSKTIAYNTIQTAKGNQYQVRLPDGTKVWLNASSSLRYPETFVGNQRKVELTGEGYFEVAKDKTHPFIVKTISSLNGIIQEVQVLGTHFNINSYMDEKVIKTTLLEGSVRVSNEKAAKTLRPGEQSQLDANNISIISADTDDETAWKNGLFRFNNSSLTIILNQLERWYDVKIDYGTIPNKRFNGMVPRTANLSQVLKMLELTGDIGFRIEENKQLKVFTK
jgi:transmembrane sensor